MNKSRTTKGKTEAIPRALRVFAWNVGDRLGAFEKRQIALNVIERGRAWHWTKLPKGWFDLQFCLEHAQKKTKEALRGLFPDAP
jgi:hypothetical protein